MFGTYSSFFLWVCTSFYTFARAAISPSLEGVASCRKVIVQLCLNSWMSLKPLWLSKQHTLFLVVHSGWSCAKPCQYPKGKDLSQHLDAGWLEVRLSGSTCKVCKFHRKTRDGHFCLLCMLILGESPVKNCFFVWYHFIESKNTSPTFPSGWLSRDVFSGWQPQKVSETDMYIGLCLETRQPGEEQRMSVKGTCWPP